MERLLTVIGYAISLVVFAITIPIMALGLLLILVILEVMGMVGSTGRHARNVPQHVLDMIRESETTKVVVTPDDISIVRKEKEKQ